MILITRDGMGHAEQPLRHKLIATYLQLVREGGMLPGAIAFYADGVKLVVEGSPILEALRAVEARGVHLIVCKTCLDHFDLLDKLRVGIVGGMADILSAQWAAKKVITL
jgi:intracellular sulfur oxidation DsrE/DsrF family protein